MQAINAKKLKINNKGQNMGQIVKTWVKVLGLNDPYRNHMAQGLKTDMGQIVIYSY